MDEARQIEVADIHDILRNDRRRAVLSSLQSNSGEATIRDLSEHIAALESEEKPPPRNVRQSVYVSLHQTHLPKLDELGIVDYDTDAKTVKLRSKAEAVKEFMDDHEKSTVPWPKLYFAIAAIGLVAATSAVVGAFPAGIDLNFSLAVMFGFILLLAGYHWWSTQP